MVNADNNENNRNNNNNQNRDIEEARLVMDAVGGIANFALNAHGQYRDGRQQAGERQRAEEQRRQDNINRDNQEFIEKLEDIYGSLQPYVQTASLLDTEFNIDEESYLSTIRDLVTTQKDRFSALDTDIKGWWIPCAKSKAKVINSKLKDKADSAIDYLRESLDKLNEFALQGPENCDYKPLQEARKNYINAKDFFEWAVADGIKAMSNKDLSKNSIRRAESSIDSGLKALEEFSDVLDTARIVYPKKVIKVLYNTVSGLNDLNLTPFFQDLIKDIKEEGTKVPSDVEIKRHAKNYSSKLISDIVLQQNNDIDRYKEIFKNTLQEKVKSREDLNIPSVKSALDRIELPQFIKDEELRIRFNDIDSQEELTIKSISIHFSENDSEGITILGSDNNSVEEVHSDFSA